MTALSLTSRINKRDALSVWHHVIVDNVARKGPDFTSRQLAVLTTVYLETGPHTVRSLAQKLGVTKAVVTRAIDRLELEKFLCRQSDPSDGRSIILARTGPGSVYLSRFADQICVRMNRRMA